MSYVPDSYTAKKERFLRLPEVIARTGLSRSTIYLSVHQGQFPAQIQIARRGIAWLESEVEAWMHMRTNLSRVSNRTRSSG